MLVKTYMKLKIKKFFFKNLRTEKFLGFKVNFFDYSTFVSLFEEIFIKKEYFFVASTNQPLIYDCGANIGMSVLFFKKLYPKSRIVAFEPDNKSFELLEENIKLNKLDNIKLVNKAVSSRKGNIAFYYDKEKSGSLCMSLLKDRSHSDIQNIESVLLSDYVRKEIDFLKMDIEGAENEAIQELAANNKLEMCNEVVIEYHHNINHNEQSLSKFLNILESNGFGYQVTSALNPPFSKNKFQDILIYAYKK